MGEIEYRNLRPTDYDEIVKVWDEAELPVRLRGRDSRDRIQTEMERSPDFLIGAFDEHRMVGLIIGTFDGRRGTINRLAVVPGYRKRKIGEKLTKICEDRLRKAGATVIFGLVEKSNATALKFFEGLGYKIHDDIIYISKRDNPEA
jgi:ribosomal protein S18 acetylase RimI-like enzyme